MDKYRMKTAINCLRAAANVIEEASEIENTALRKALFDPMKAEFERQVENARAHLDRA